MPKRAETEELVVEEGYGDKRRQQQQQNQDQDVQQQQNQNLQHQPNHIQQPPLDRALIPLIIRRHPFTSSLTRQLIAELDDELTEMYPDPAHRERDGLFVPEEQQTPNVVVSDETERKGADGDSLEDGNGGVVFMVAFVSLSTNEGLSSTAAAAGRNQEKDETSVAGHDAEADEKAAGCVAIKPHFSYSLTTVTTPANLPPHTRTAELKRMYTRRPYRTGQYRVGQRLLVAAEWQAREMGVELLLLETGIRQHAAMRLYARNGWRRRETFGVYVGVGVDDGDEMGVGGGMSVCFEKWLV